MSLFKFIAKSVTMKPKLPTRSGWHKLLSGSSFRSQFFFPLFLYNLRCQLSGTNPSVASGLALIWALSAHTLLFLKYSRRTISFISSVLLIGALVKLLCSGVMKLDGKPARRLSSTMRLVGEVSGGAYIDSEVFILAFHSPEYFRQEKETMYSRRQQHSKVEEEIGAWI